jgi:hypothetical protein
MQRTFIELCQGSRDVASPVVPQATGYHVPGASVYVVHAIQCIMMTMLPCAGSWHATVLCVPPLDT